MTDEFNRTNNTKFSAERCLKELEEEMEFVANPMPFEGFDPLRENALVDESSASIESIFDNEQKKQNLQHMQMEADQQR